MGLMEDFATWTEKTRRKLLREHGARGKAITALLPAGVPVAVHEGLEFVDALLGSTPPEEIHERASKWRDKLCRIPRSRRGPSSQV
jgi:hypothetical protein